MEVANMTTVPSALRQATSSTPRGGSCRLAPSWLSLGILESMRCAPSSMKRLMCPSAQ
jgi:hypothetical protein